MEAVKEDLNIAQPVTEPDLNADSVNQPDLKTDPVNQTQQDGTLADGTSKDKTVKYEEFEKAIKAKNDAQEQKLYAQRQLELIQQNAQQPAPVVAKTAMEQAMVDCGTTAEEMGYDGAMQVKVQNRKDQIVADRTQQSQSMMASQQFMMTHPDMNQVVGSVNPSTGQIIAPSAELVALLTKKPYLAGACTLEGAYQLVMEEREIAKLKSTSTAATEHQKRQTVDNITQPLGGSAAGGGGGEVQGQGLMSRDQQREIERKLDAGEEIT